jgi:hypothetical protein
MKNHEFDFLNDRLRFKREKRRANKKDGKEGESNQFSKITFGIKPSAYDTRFGNSNKEKFPLKTRLRNIRNKLKRQINLFVASCRIA